MSVLGKSYIVLRVEPPFKAFEASLVRLKVIDDDIEVGLDVDYMAAEFSESSNVCGGSISYCKVKLCLSKE